MKETLHIYSRVSTRSQLEGDSIKVQKDLGIKKAIALGMSHKIWDEENASSNHETFHNRPVMRELLFSVERGEIKHIFAFDDDRLSRNEQTQFELKTAFRRQGVVLYTNKSTTNFDDPTDRLMKQIFDAFASYDNQMRTIRSRLGKIEKVKRGEWHGGHTPYGFEVENKKLSPHPKESEYVKWMYEQYASGMSVMAMKKHLDKKGVLARRGDLFSTGSINKLLTNTHHKGTYSVTDHYFEETYEVKCPSIVSEQVWNDCERKRKGNELSIRQKRQERKFYLLNGLLHCGHCGTRMAGRIVERKNERLYYCPKKQRDWKKGDLPNEEKYVRGKTKSAGCGMTKSLSIPLTDAFVWHYVKEVVKDSSLLKELFKTEVMETLSSEKTVENINKEQAKQKRLEKEREGTLDTLAEVETEYLLETSNDETKQKLHQKITNRITVRLDNLKNEMLQVDKNIEALRAERNWIDWVSKYGEQVNLQTDAKPEEQRDYLQGLIDKIDVWEDDENGGHKIIIHFNIGIVEDEILYNDPNQKNKGYEVKEGQKKVGGLIPKSPKGRSDKEYPLLDYSTVTDFAKFRGWSTSVPFNSAT
jgi:DNA invertase Pin-like site-specific DNA recombinase